MKASRPISWPIVSASWLITESSLPTRSWRQTQVTYLLTEKGIDLAPVLTEMVLWAAAHEDTGNQALVRLMREDKKKFLAGVRQRWAQRNTRRSNARRA